MSEHDAEQRVRAALGDLGYGRNITVTPDDLTEVLRQLDEARCFADITQALAEVDRLTRERDEARQIARMFLSYTGGPCAAWLSARHLGTSELPDWLTAVQQPAAGPHHTDTTTSEGN